MHTLAAMGAGFLLAVLWFDLMFDVQARRDPVPVEALESIASYYRRVTIGAFPMNRLVSFMMLLTLLALAGEAVERKNAVLLAGASLLAALCPIGLALFRTVRNAMKLARGEGSTETRIARAQSIYRDHVLCLVAIVVLIGLQLATR
jgi:hypothetical protein